MICEGWHEYSEFQWMLTDERNFVVAQIKHFPIGWQLNMRLSTKHKWQEYWYPDDQLDEAKAWALAMIRMQ